MFISSIFCFGQKDDTLYYDKEKKQVREITVYDGSKKTTTQYYQDGTKSFVDVYNGKDHVSYTGWYKSGEKRQEDLYEKGKLVKSRIWFQGGKLEKEHNYKLVEKDGTIKNIPDGDYIENYANGSPRTKGKYVDGQKDGEWLTYYEDGKKKEATNFKNGFKNGKSEFWFKGGNKAWEIYFITVQINGKPRELKHGKKIAWHENGTKIEESNYVNDKKTGLFEEWYPNGTKKAEIEMKNDWVNGKAKQWLENGKVKLNAFYVQEYDSVNRKLTTKYEGKYEKFNDNGNPEVSGNYLNGEKEGKWIEYHNNGQKSNECEFKNGQRVGKDLHWDREGKLVMDQNYVLIEKDGKKIGVLDGEQIRYYGNGQLRTKGAYKKGKEDGTFTQWYEDGKKIELVNYCNGAKCGKYTAWHRNGNLREERNYLLLNEGDSTWSVLDGEEKKYDESGKVTRSNFFINGKVAIRTIEYNDEGNIKNYILHFLFSEYGHPTCGPNTSYFANGKTETEAFNFQSRQPGRVLNYFINGSLKSVIDFNINGAKNGNEIQYDADGEVVSARYYTAYNKFDSINKKIAKAIYDSIMQRPKPGFKLSDEKKEGEWITWFDRKHKQFEGTFVNGKLNGPFTAYYPDGRKMIETELKDGTVNGRLVAWNRNGNKYHESNYLMGELNGPSIVYYENGQKERESGYTAGKKMIDYQLEWYADGKKKSEIHYDPNGKQTGYAASWNDKGQVTSETNFDGGKYEGVSKSFHQNGKLRYEHPYKAGLQEGESIDYYESGKKHFSTNYKAGKKEGWAYIWYENGTLSAKGIHRNDDKDSVWVMYNEDGTEKARTRYNKGIIQRETTGLECECIDSTKRKISFAPLLKHLASREEVNAWAFNFHAPIGEFYDHLFYIGLQNSSNNNAAFYTFDIVAYQPIYIKVPDEKGLKLIFNPCINTGSLESRTNININLDLSDKKRTDVTVSPDRLSIEFNSGLLRQWNKKENKPFKDDKNKDIQSTLLFSAKSVDYNERERLRINNIGSPCFPLSEIGKTGLLIDFKNFYADLDAARTPSEIDFFLNTYYSYDKTQKNEDKFIEESGDKFTGVFAPEAILTLPKNFCDKQAKDFDARCTDLMISSNYLIGTLTLNVKPADGTNYTAEGNGETLKFSAKSLEDAFLTRGFSKAKSFYDTEKSQLNIYFYYKLK